MRNSVACALTAVLLAAGTPGAVAAAEPAAPPMLTPSLARTVASACPNAAVYTDKLIGGITRAEAKAATPILTRCAREIRLFVYQWKNDAASIALAAVDLSRGVLDHDPVLLRAAADATRDLRRASRATDIQVREWTIIPDYFDVARNELAVEPQPACGVSAVANATYINVAARTGNAWITIPREALAQGDHRSPGCAFASRDIGDGPEWPNFRAGSRPADASPLLGGQPAIEPVIHDPLPPRPPQ
jgi:hypothetical protein